VFENRVLRRIYGPNSDEILGGWRKLHEEHLHNLYSSPNIIRMNKVKEDEMGRACSTQGSKEGCIEGFGGRAKRIEITRKTYTQGG
jgi:hypothetical protein